MVRAIALANRKYHSLEPVGPKLTASDSLAYMEMRVLMAKFLYNFDSELAYPDDKWVSTKKAYGAWNNSGLKLRLRPAGK